MTILAGIVAGLLMGALGAVVGLLFGLYRIGCWYRDTERRPAVQFPQPLGNSEQLPQHTEMKVYHATVDAVVKDALYRGMN